MIRLVESGTGVSRSEIPQSPQPDVASDESRLSITDTLFHWCFQHWLLLVNGLVLLFVGLAWLSPLLIALGYVSVGEFLFRLYTPLCHQNPHNSPFLFGHQVGICVRESAMYLSLFAGGLIYAGVRHRLVQRPLSLRVAALLLVPLVLDGITQTIDGLMPWLALRSPEDGVGTFNWWLRVVSGMLFALAVVLAIYPRLDRDLRGFE